MNDSLRESEIAQTVENGRDVPIRRARGHAKPTPAVGAAPPAQLTDLIRPDLRYHYALPLGARRWLDVCEDPQYAHGELIETTRLSVPRMLREALGLGNGHRVAVVSLGPGDGRLDAAVIESLHATTSLVSFVGVDASRHLLELASSRLAASTAAQEGVPFDLIHGDFFELSPKELPPTARGVSRLFVLLGLTFGNYREGGLLSDIADLLGTDDLLLLDARLHEFGADVDPLCLSAAQRATLLATYDREKARRFSFAPVEAHTMSSSEDVTFQCEIGRQYTDVPGALNIVTYCEHLTTAMRGSGTPVQLPRLDLSVTSAYDGPRLLAWLGSQGLDVIAGEASGGTMRVLTRVRDVGLPRQG